MAQIVKTQKSYTKLPNLSSLLPFTPKHRVKNPFGQIRLSLDASRAQDLAFSFSFPFALFYRRHLFRRSSPDMRFVMSCRLDFDSAFPQRRFKKSGQNRCYNNLVFH